MPGALCTLLKAFAIYATRVNSNDSMDITEHFMKMYLIDYGKQQLFKQSDK